ncbi:hypothetical protein GCM10011581_32290 [Saccharopolyspora subtropica]|uniref:Uncharacterized protein n=1 Tax=Saccharopolyspora thermophila TaxID=89367 RepID=A0A917JYM6_9PSEU|nr:hypothetical protein [Saccharopolyspora subtropica]GGI92671.1 hypothetical protein GCM10011581_32290 [Saccharopolyspora subtropica]
MFGDKPGGEPRPPAHDDRTLRRALPVWVDLAKVYPLAERPDRMHRVGWDLQAVVPGELSAWRRDTTGRWLAQVHFRIRRGDDSEGVLMTAWLLASAIEPRHDAPARPERRKRLR